MLNLVDVTRHPVDNILDLVDIPFFRLTPFSIWSIAKAGQWTGPRPIAMTGTEEPSHCPPKNKCLSP